MKGLIEKLSSYNIFNYLLPGVIFVAVSDPLTKFSLVQDDILIAVFLYYFIGLVISRIGSIVIEPLLKKIGFVRFSDYGDYVSASKEDTLLETLSESNNMYRTFCSLFLCLGLLKAFELVSDSYPSIEQFTSEILVGGLLTLFVFSYRKQTSYINKRVQKANERD